MQELATWVSDDLYAKVVTAAEARGCSVNDFVVDELRAYVGDAEPPSGVATTSSED
jgi:predicted HicB family RNase H-like nuclease